MRARKRTPDGFLALFGIGMLTMYCLLTYCSESKSTDSNSTLDLKKGVDYEILDEGKRKADEPPPT